MNTQSENLKELAIALAKFHTKVGPITANRKVSYGSGANIRKFNYADLSAIWEVIRKPLAECGLSVIQSVDGTNLNTMLLHESGAYLSNSVGLGIAPNIAHKDLGAAITYMRRYTLVSLLSLATDEDEGEEPEAKVELNIPPKEVFISPQQVAELKAILEHGILPHEANYTEVFLKVNKLPSLEKMPLDSFQRAHLFLTKKAQTLNEANVDF